MKKILSSFKGTETSLSFSGPITVSDRRRARGIRSYVHVSVGWTDADY